jgi:hypothetical protein
MKNLVLATVLLGIAAVVGAGVANADAVSGELWINNSAVARDATLANVGGLGTPDATFTPGAIDYQSQVISYAIGGFLNNPTFSNESADFISNGGASAGLDNTLIYLTGTVGLVAGSNSFVLAHDDGVALNIDGIGDVLDEPGPTSEDFSPFSVTEPSTGNYAFELAYGECCGKPADLAWSINDVTVGNALKSVILALLGVSLLGFALYRRYKERFTPPPFLPYGRIVGPCAYDAVEDFAVKHRRRRTTIWQAVLQAYKSGALPKRYREGVKVPPGWSLDSILDNSIRGALDAVLRGDFRTAHWSWIKCLAADEDFHRWLTARFRKSPISPSRRIGAKPMKSRR